MMTSQNISTYNDCVASLSTSLGFLESSVETLGNGVSDFPRLITILKTIRHYELIPQPTLAAAEASLRDEIGPFIALLLDRAERQLQRQERRIDTLKARAELLQGRLYEDDTSSRTKRGGGRTGGSATAAAGAGGRLGAEERLRARAVRQRKEALKYGVERLELEVLQKERELRKRVES